VTAGSAGGGERSESDLTLGEVGEAHLDHPWLVVLTASAALVALVVKLLRRLPGVRTR
jgi:hypothetical protein